MEPWQVGLVIVMTVGVGVILAGALIDRTRGRARERALSAPPDRPIPGLPASSGPGGGPAYVAERDARRTPEGAAVTALTATDRVRLAAATRTHTPVRARLASRDFLTDTDAGWAVLDSPRVLVCAEPVETYREILGVVGAHDPLVVVAPAFADDVRRTLEVNRVQRLHRLAAVTADDGARVRLAELTGAHPLTRRDLQSGWTPDEALGSAATWVAATDRSWVLSDAP
ncbi:hypothetical protein [Mariniluteicoccus flavus]